MDFELVVVQGRSASSTIKLSDGVTTIGRQNECQLRIKSSQVSRKHCELFEKKGLLLVKDLGSSNGTLVNGKKVQGQRVLEPGDELTIGPVLLRVAKVGAPPQENAARKASPAPGDTAVTAAAAVAAGSNPDEFTIDFDEPSETPETVVVGGKKAQAPTKPAKEKPKAPSHDDDAIADFLMDIEVEGEEETIDTAPTPPSKQTSPAPAPAEAKAEVAHVEEPKKKESGKVPEASDDAIADFLLDIKLDDEE